MEKCAIGEAFRRLAVANLRTLIMASHRDPLSAQRRPRERYQGRLRSLACSAAMRSDPSQKSGLEASGRRQVRSSERISRLRESSEDGKLKQRHSLLLTKEACTHSFWYTIRCLNLPSHRITRLLYHRRATSEPEK